MVTLFKKDVIKNKILALIYKKNQCVFSVDVNNEFGHYLGSLDSGKYDIRKIKDTG